MEPSDEERLAASVRDPHAFAAFYRRHAVPLTAFFLRRTGDRERAADLTAETFAAALQERRRFDPARGTAVAWLYGVARHQLARALESGRVAAVEARVVAEQEYDEIAHAHATTEAAIRKRVSRGLARLRGRLEDSP